MFKKKEKKTQEEQEFLEKASKHGRVDTFTKKKKRHFGFNTETEYTVTYAPESSREPPRYSDATDLEMGIEEAAIEKMPPGSIVGGQQQQQQQVVVTAQPGGDWLTMENLEKGVKLAVTGMTLIAGAVQVVNLVTGKGGHAPSLPSKQKDGKI